LVIPDGYSPKKARICGLFLRFEGKIFRCKTVDAFQQFSQKKGVEPYTTKISNKSADFERIPL